MYKKISVCLLLLAIAFAVGGCPYFMNPSHTRAHKATVDTGLDEMHRFMDRHFWNYDWDSPYNN